MAPADWPVVTVAVRPTVRWSVMIPTYEADELLARTITSVLDQDPGPEHMQIEVVDDHSTSADPEAVVRTLAGGRVGFYRQPHNLGVTGNLNACLARSRGELVHVLHGDDMVLPGFYDALGVAFAADDEIGAAFCRQIYMDADDHWLSLTAIERRTPGRLEGFVERIFTENVVQTPAIVVRRSVYEAVGGFDTRLAHTADWEMWRRIAICHPVWYEPRPLALYRMHVGSDTYRLMRSAANVADLLRSIELSRPHLADPVEARRLTALARERVALYAMGSARHLVANNEARAAASQVRAGWRSARTPAVARAVAGVAVVGGRVAGRRAGGVLKRRRQ